jgi:hypothetical protein
VVLVDDTDSSCSSPRLNDSDYALLDRAYWLANPTRLSLLQRRIFGDSDMLVPQTEDKEESDWVADL